MAKLAPITVPLLNRKKGDVPPEVESAIAVLSAYAGGERAAAEVLIAKSGEYVSRNYGRRTRSPACWRWLLGKGRSMLSYTDWMLPGDDHVEYYQKGERRFRISHPYGMSFDQVAALVDHCRANGLKFSIDPSSWYFPGSTVAVVLEKDDKGSAGNG